MIGYIVVKAYDYEGCAEVNSGEPSQVYLDYADAQKAAEAVSRPSGVDGEIWPVLIPGGDEVKVGQVWASNDRRDIERNERQRRHVTSVSDDRAFLQTEGSRYKGSFGVKIKDGKVDRHRLVEDV